MLGGHVQIVGGNRLTEAISLEHRIYGGGYKACSGCDIQTRIGDLVDDRCEKCRPKHACISCLIELGPAESVSVDGNWTCRDLTACAERVWRTAAKAADMRADQIKRSQMPQGKYLHHNADCDYVDGWWACPEPCAVSDPDLG